MSVELKNVIFECKSCILDNVFYKILLKNKCDFGSVVKYLVSTSRDEGSNLNITKKKQSDFYHFFDFKIGIKIEPTVT